MKKFLRGILTVWIMVLLVAFGLVLSFKSIIINTADDMIKKEIAKNVVNAIDKSQEEIPRGVITEVENAIQNDESIKNLIDKHLDSIIEAIGNPDFNKRIDVSEDIDKVIKTGETIIEKYDINISNQEKEELLSMISKDKVNNLINETIQESRESLNTDTKEILRAYQFLNGNTIKIILLALIIVSAVLIALLRKGYYTWLINLASSFISAGILTGILCPLTINSILEMIEPEEKMAISMVSLSIYGYILIVLGIVFMITTKIIDKQKEKKFNIILE